MRSGIEAIVRPNGDLISEDVIDADYVVVSPGMREAVASSRSTPFVDAMGGMEMLRKKAASVEAVKKGSPLFWGIGIVLAAMAFWAAGGHELVSRNTFTAKISPQSLRIAAFNSRVVDTGVRPSLVIDGEAINGGTATAELPPIEIQVTSANGAMTRYKLGTAGARLGVGDVFPFSGRLDLPKHGVKTVTVAFVE